jgi:maltooligosyltrehalose synthase
MRLMRVLLRVRHDFRLLFRHGDYSPLDVENDDAFGFARSYRRQRVVVMTGRRFAARSDGGRSWPRQWEWKLKDESLTGHIDVLSGDSASSPNGVLPVAVFLKA